VAAHAKYCRIDGVARAVAAALRCLKFDLAPSI